MVAVNRGRGKSDKVNILIAGQSLNELTRVATTGPNSLVLDCGSSKSVLANQGVPHVEIKSERDLFEVKKALDGTDEEVEQRFGVPVKTLVFDRLDEYQRMVLSDRLAADGRIETDYPDWQWLNDRLYKIFDAFTALDLNFVATSLYNDTEPDHLKISRQKLNVMGGFVTGMLKYYDYALLLTSSDRGGEKEGSGSHLRATPYTRAEWIQGLNSEKFIDAGYDCLDLLIADFDELRDSQEVIEPLELGGEPVQVDKAENNKGTTSYDEIEQIISQELASK